MTKERIQASCLQCVCRAPRACVSWSCSTWQLRLPRKHMHAEELRPGTHMYLYICIQKKIAVRRCGLGRLPETFQTPALLHMRLILRVKSCVSGDEPMPWLAPALHQPIRAHTCSCRAHSTLNNNSTSSVRREARRMLLSMYFLRSEDHTDLPVTTRHRAANVWSSLINGMQILKVSESHSGARPVWATQQGVPWPRAPLGLSLRLSLPSSNHSRELHHFSRTRLQG